MLITEILKKAIPNLKLSGNKPINDILSPLNKRLIGLGSQVITYLHDKFPDRVIKTIQISGTADPQYQFLRVCLKHQNNPFFPKIMVFKAYRTYIPPQSKYKTQREFLDNDYRLKRISQFDEFIDPDELIPDPSKYTLFLVVERLYHITEIELAQQLQRLNVRPTIDDLSPTERDRSRQAHNLTTYIINVAFQHTAFRKQALEHTTNPEFKQALRLLEPLFRHFYPDMNPTNFMVRNDGQLVLTDPVSR